MKRTTKLLSILFLLAILLIPATPAFAKGPFDGGPVIFGGNYTLESGKTLDGDLVVFGGNVVIEEEALVKGSIVVFGGTVTLDGTVSEDVVLIGGSGSMGAKSIVKGDLVTVGGSVSRAEGARVEGEFRSEPAIEIPAPTVPDVPNVPTPPIMVDSKPFSSAYLTLGFAILMAALSMLLTLFLQPQMDRVGEAIVRQPILAGGFGLLVVFASIVTVITVIFLPVVWLLGVASLGSEAGKRFTRMIGQSWAPVFSAGFGTFLLVLVVNGIGLFPCIGWLLAPLPIGLVCIGAVVLTMFGSRAYPPAMAAPAPGPSEALPPAS